MLKEKKELKIISILAISFVIVFLLGTIVYGLTQLKMVDIENYKYCTEDGRCEYLGDSEKEYLRRLDLKNSLRAKKN